MYPRFLEPITQSVLSISPAVLIAGPRQVGKSTLSMKLISQYILLDDVSIRNSAKEDPVGFIQSYTVPLCLDEIQKAPELIEAIKLAIDKNRENGAYLLSGSASLLDMKGVGDTLAGRLISLTMWPLSIIERMGHTGNFIDMLYNGDYKNKSMNKCVAYETFISMIISGGYPEAIKIKNTKLRSYWFASYISTYIERDVRDIGEIRNLNNFIKLFNLLAPRSANLFNIKSLAKDSGISEATVSNYLTLLKMVYQIEELKPYYSNISKRFVKSPKVYFTDSGVLAHLLNIQTVNDFNKSPQKGLFLETFVFSELLKYTSYSEKKIDIYHYRTSDQKEIDFILEINQKIIAIEVKASQKVDKSAFKHIIDLQNKSTNFHSGIVFYLGENILPFGENLTAIPLKLLTYVD